MTDQEQQDQPPPVLAEALSNANALLISSLAAGSIPCADDSQLKDRIAAYRASIQGLSKQLEQLGDAATAQIPKQQQHPAAEQDEPSSIPGIGQEGVDYTVITLQLHNSCS